MKARLLGNALCFPVSDESFATHPLVSTASYQLALVWPFFPHPHSKHKSYFGGSPPNPRFILGNPVPFVFDLAELDLILPVNPDLWCHGVLSFQWNPP